MRALLILSILFLIVMVVFVPISYFWTARTLPALNSEFDLERNLRGYIEGERMGARAGLAPSERAPVDFQRPDLTRYPKDLVGLWISSWDCPTYFQTPRETGGKWAWRMFVAQFFNVQLPGDGRCERIFALSIAQALKIKGAQAQAIAAHKIHTLLQKDQLVAYAMATVTFERSVIGVEDGSKRLFQRQVDTLKLEELAELQLAMAPHYYFEDIRNCRNPSLIRQARDFVISELAFDGLIPEDRARAAMAQAVGCGKSR